MSVKPYLTKPTQPYIELRVILKVLRCPKVLRNSCTDPYLFKLKIENKTLLPIG